MRRAWIGIGVVVGALSIAAALWWRAPRDDGSVPLASSSSPAVPAPAVGPPPPGTGQARPPDPNGGLPYKAMDGSIYTDKLFWGCIGLESSPFPTTPEQARGVLTAIGLLEAKLRKNQFYDQQLVAELTPAQLAYTEARVASLSADGMHAEFHPDHIHSVVAQLEAISGQLRPADPVPVPDNVEVPERPLTVSRMTSFMIAWDSMQADTTLRVDRAQAARLLPLVDSYVRLKSMKQQTKTDILAVLTEPQKKWIDTHPALDQEISDMTVLTARLKALMTEKAGA